MYLPPSFPLVSHGWLSLQTVAYGAPWAGTPPAGISIIDGYFRYQRNLYATKPWQIAWTAPAVRRQWYRFTWHFLFAKNGWIELYVNRKLV